MEVVVQVNGKLRSRLSVERGTNQTELTRLATSDPKVLRHIESKTVRNVIVIPNKLVNFVVD